MSLTDVSVAQIRVQYTYSQNPEVLHVNMNEILGSRSFTNVTRAGSSQRLYVNIEHCTHEQTHSASQCDFDAGELLPHAKMATTRRIAVETRDASTQHGGIVHVSRKP